MLGHPILSIGSGGYDVCIRCRVHVLVLSGVGRGVYVPDLRFKNEQSGATAVVHIVRRSRFISTSRTVFNQYGLTR